MSNPKQDTATKRTKSKTESKKKKWTGKTPRNLKGGRNKLEITETRDEVIDDLKKCIKNYRRAYPDSDHMIERDYYRVHTTIPPRVIEHYFGSFSTFTREFKKEFPDFLDEVNTQKTKIKLGRLQSEVRELEKERKQLIAQHLNEAKILEDYHQYVVQEVKYPVPAKFVAPKNEKVFILNLSDIHLGEIVYSQFVNNSNEYNKDICVRRLDQIFNWVRYYSDMFSISTLYIIMNGDLFSGGIHQELARNHDLNEVEAIFFLQRYFHKILPSLGDIFNEIHIEVVVGNHGRILPGRPYHKEQTTMSYEYIFGHQLKMYFDLLRENGQNNKITVNVPDSPFSLIKIKNTVFLITHGNILSGKGKGGFAGIPFYAITQSSAKLYGVLHQLGMDDNVKFDHILCGHLHTPARIPIFTGGFCLVNGCVIGTNEYSMNEMKSVAKKEQTLLVVDDRGIESMINIEFE